MGEVSTIGLDIAKSVFQVHGVDAEGDVVIRRRVRRADVVLFFGGVPRCLVGMEACGSAHDWARRLTELGHRVRLLAPAHVKPYVRPGRKNDAADAAAICEAVTRPHMQAVPVKNEESQATLLLHRTRDLLVRQRTTLICAVRSHLAEFGVVAGQGRGGFTKLVTDLEVGDGGHLPAVARAALSLLVAQIDDANRKIEALEKAIVAQQRSNEAARRLATIPGIGPIIASALTAAVADPSAFKSGRQFAAWLGLVPRQNSTGGKARLGSITKAGDRYLRRLLVVGATSLIRFRRRNVPGGLAWLTSLLARKPVRLVTVALANKMARIAWAVLARGETYRESSFSPAA